MSQILLWRCIGHRKHIFYINTQPEGYARMKIFTLDLKYFATTLAAAALGIAAATAFGQDGYKEKDSNKDMGAKTERSESGFCSNNNWSSGSRVSFNELRELTASASGTVKVDAGRNGGVNVVGEDRGDVLVRACVQAWGSSDEAARAGAANIRITTVGTIRAENIPEEGNASVSFQLVVPRTTNLELKAHNGGIVISGVDGTAEFETTNGGVVLKNVSGDVKGRTTNGGVNVTLSGPSWRGTGLDVITTNGGVHLSMPANYAARVETGTVNGGYSSDIPALNIPTESVKGDQGQHKVKRINTTLNGGGAPIRVITTNGGVRISSQDK